MSDSVNQPRTFEVLTAAPVRARRKPRDWPNEEKERLIAETLWSCPQKTGHAQA
ncbi:hypothetical protein [Sinorhizobium medicae]